MGLKDDFRKYQSLVVANKSEQYAMWTDASLFPDANTESGKSVDPITLSRDWQSFGQQILNFAASKTVENLFPIGKAFFKIDASAAVVSRIGQVLTVDPAKVPGALVESANVACKRIHWKGNYARLTHAAKVLFCTGNVLLYKRPDGSILAYSTRNYSVKRDGTGQPLRGVLKEQIAYRMLPAAAQAGHEGQVKDSEELIDIYTGCEWQADGNVKIWQETGSWSSSPDTVRAELCPFLFLTFDLIPGESYGRGAVEANAGDFSRYSELSRALTLYEIESCKVIKAVRPGAAADIDALNEAESGEYVQADPEAVAAIEFGDSNKIAELRNELQAIEQRLAKTFGYGGNMRDAERVTAYEVALQAGEIDTLRGGLYSRLSYSWSYPLALLFLQDTDPVVLNLVLNNQASIGLVTGIPALGQSAEIRSLLQAANNAQLIVAALMQVSTRFSPDRIADLVLLSEQFNPENIEKTEEELQAEAAASAPMDPLDPNNLSTAIQGVQVG